MIVDASVAIKWLVKETDSDKALALIGETPLMAPDLIHAEVANAIWKQAMRGAIRDMQAYLSRLSEIIDVITPCWELAEAATALAVALNHPAHGCFYLALAVAENTELVTADYRLVAACAGTAHAGRMRLLG